MANRKLVTSRSAFKTGITFLGDWPGTVRKYNRLDMAIKKAFALAMEDIALEYYELIKSHLLKQDIPGWTPLSTSRKKQRTRKGWPATPPLLASRTYLTNIDMFRDRGNWVVGIRKGIRHPESKLKVDQLAALHERWSYEGGPYRPLWRYTFNAPKPHGLGGTRGMRKTINILISEELRRRGY